MVAALLSAAAGLAWAAFERLTLPFWLLLGIWAGLAVAGIVLLRRPAIRTPLLTIASVLVVLFVGESILVVIAALPPKAVFVRKGDCWNRELMSRFDPYVAGYGPSQPADIECHKTRNGQLIFDAVYGFDEHHLRRTAGNPQGDTVLFFGCSFTFGHGLDDDETLPYLVSRELGYRYNVRNFGFTGNGPQQMLAALEQGLPPDLISGRVRRVFFTAIDDHVYRVGGVRSEPHPAPQYALDGSGEVRLVDAASLGASGPPTLQSWYDYLAADTRWQLALVQGIVKKSARLVRERFGVPLTIVLWDDRGKLTKALLKRFERLGLEVVLVSGILPIDHQRIYRIPYDGHPTAEANRLIAERLARMIE
jgi:hypothetical protein